MTRVKQSNHNTEISTIASFLLVAMTILLAGESYAQSIALQQFDQDVSPDILYGSGNSNGAFSRKLDNNVEVGIRIHDRFDGDSHSNGDGTYTPDAGFYSGSSGPAIWNYDFAINLNQDGGSDTLLFDEVVVELLIDIDPTLSTSFLSLDPLNVFSDNAYGTNATANGDGDDGSAINATLGVSAAYYIAQNSQNIGWMFTTSGEKLFDVTEDATYDFSLKVTGPDGSLLAATDMQVIVGAGGQSIDRQIADLKFLDANLESCMLGEAATNGWTTVSEMISLSCVGENIQFTVGIDQLPSLVSLDLSDNPFTTINLDGLPALTSLTLIDSAMHPAAISYLNSMYGKNGLVVSTQSIALQPVDQDVSPDILYGSGNSNGAFSRKLDNNVEVGIRIHDRFNGDAHSNGDGTYTPDAGFYSGSSGPAIWNYDFAINLNQDGGSDPLLFDEVVVELLIDIDPTLSTSFLSLDPLNVFSDNAYGTNATANGDGDDGSAINATLGVSAAYYIAQNSQNIGWMFTTSGEKLFDVTEDATYDFSLKVTGPDGSLLAATDMQVIVGAGGQSIDRQIADLKFLDANLESCMLGEAATNGWTTVSEMISLSCVGENIQFTAGIDQLSSLVSLDLSDNPFTTINVDGLPALTALTLIDNALHLAAISYLNSIDGQNGLVVTRAVIVAPTPIIFVLPSVPDVIDPVTESKGSIDDQINDIAIEDGEEVSQEKVDAITQVLDEASSLAEETSEKVASGEIEIDEALAIVDTLGDALALAGEASNQGGDIGTEKLSASVDNIAEVINSLDGNDFDALQMESVKQAAEKATNSVAELLESDLSSIEVEKLVDSVERLFEATGNAAIPIDENLVMAAKKVSQQALNTSISDLADELGIEFEADSRDIETTRALLEGSINLLAKVIDVAAIEIPSNIELDQIALLENLDNKGLDQAVAKNLAQDLSNFVNPMGVNLELGNGASVNALDAIVESTGDSSIDIAVEELTGSLKITVGDSSVSANVAKVVLVPAEVPEGITVLPDGSVLSVANGVGINLVPAPSDPIGLVDALTKNVEDLTLETDGGITMTLAGNMFSGTFGFDDSSSDGTGSGTTEVLLDTPQGTDPTDPEYTFVVRYPDGSSQNIAPFVAVDNFFDSLGSRGLNFSTSRSTGIVSISDVNTGAVGNFRPDYFVTPMTSEDRAFLALQADATGIAYRGVDINGDGIQDFEIISSSGVQVIYGLP